MEEEGLNWVFRTMYFTEFINADGNIHNLYFRNTKCQTPTLFSMVLIWGLSRLKPIWGPNTLYYMVISVP